MNTPSTGADTPGMTSQAQQRFLSRSAWCLGATLQALVLGLLLAQALITLASWSGATRVFRYEAF